MEIVKKKKMQYLFRTLRSDFSFKGKTPEVGDIIEIKDIAVAASLVEQGSVEPCDIEDKGIYITLVSFTLPGTKEKHEAKARELVELRKSDALKLMCSGYVVPQNDDQWRPYDRRLRRRNIAPSIHPDLHVPWVRRFLRS